MFKQKYVIEVKGQEDRVYRFECDPLAPLGEMHDANHTIGNVIIEHIKKSREKQKPCAQEECCEELEDEPIKVCEGEE